MNQTPWLLLDTETTGFKAPIFVVELATQRLRGWTPKGAPCRRQLIQGVAIPPADTRPGGRVIDGLDAKAENPPSGGLRTRG